MMDSIISSWMSNKIEYRDSPIHGRGLYAKSDIHKNEFVVIQSGQIVEDHKMDLPEFNQIADIGFQIERGFHICPIIINGKYVPDGIFIMNHSCDPNCGVQGQITFVAMRPIRKGEELTFDYAMTDANYEGMICSPIEPMKCNCGSSACRRIITGNDWQRKDLKGKYKGYFSEYIARLFQKEKEG